MVIEYKNKFEELKIRLGELKIHGKLFRDLKLD